MASTTGNTLLAMRRLGPVGIATMLLIFSLGFLSGYFARAPVYLEEVTEKSHLSHGSFFHVEDVESSPTIHNDENGNPIMKQQLLNPFVVPKLAGISVATLRPGQTVHAHEHLTMHEMFYVVSGHGTMQVNDEESYTAHPGSFLHVVPGEQHTLSVSEDGYEDMVILLVAVAE